MTVSAPFVASSVIVLHISCAKSMWSPLTVVAAATMLRKLPGSFGSSLQDVT